MKKTTIMAAATSALALSAGIASAQESESSFYGYILAEVADNGDTSAATGQGANGPSRFGFKSTHELGGNLTAGAQVEYSVSGADVQQGDGPGLRLANAHLAGDFGTIKVGSQWTPMYLWTTGTTDLFLSGAYAQARASDTMFRQDGAVYYTTPDLNGLQVQVGGNLESGEDELGNQNSMLDSQTIGAKYSINDLYLSASYMEVDGGDNDNAESLGFAASYDYGMGTLAAAMTDNDNLQNAGGANNGLSNVYGDTEGTPYEIVGTYNATDNWTLKAAYANSDREAGDDASIAVEAAYAFSGSVSTALGVSNPDDNFDGTGEAEEVVSAALYVAF